MEQKILIIDDDADFVFLLNKRMRYLGATVYTANTAKVGIENIKQNSIDIVILDVELPDVSGVDLVKVIKDIDKDIPIIMVSGHGDVNLVVSSMHAGASDYIQKPIKGDELWNKIVKLLEMRRASLIKREVIRSGNIIGNSVKIRRLINEISKVSGSDAPVLLRGESGTGKSIVAEAIHIHSPRRNKIFSLINCPAIPENLLESELFGHERGAFTGAVRDKIGKFENANGGTIFLDEVGDISPVLQSKLLRVLQHQEFERVGGIKTIRVNVRIIAATNRDLEEAIRHNAFREDLFYRLNVLPIVIPPLRERKEDIPLLVEYFIEYYSKKSKKFFEKISDQIMEKLMDYNWPGNIRELQNVVERAVVLGKEPRFYASDFVVTPVVANSGYDNIDNPSSLKDLKYKLLMQTLEKTGANISKAAKVMGVGRDTIYRRMKKYNIGLR